MPERLNCLQACIHIQILISPASNCFIQFWQCSVYCHLCVLHTVSSSDNYCCSLSLQPLKALCNISLSSLVKMSLQIRVMLILLAPCFWPEVEYIALLEQMESGLHREAEIAWPPAKSVVLAAAAAAPAPGKGSGGSRAQDGDGAALCPCGAGRGARGRITYLCFGSKHVWGCSSTHAAFCGEMSLSVQMAASLTCIF